MIRSATLLGLEGRAVEITAEIRRGMSVSTSVVGIGPAGAAELRVRIRSAIENSSLTWPIGHVAITVNPAADGAHLDLPVALEILQASGQLGDGIRLWDLAAFGELSLDGRLRLVRGALPLARHMAEMGARRIVAPAENGLEAALGASNRRNGGPPPVHAFGTLAEVVEWLRGDVDRLPWIPPAPTPGDDGLCLSDIRGQGEAVAALERAAVSGANVMFRGPPGAGKTMLARRLPGILPMMSEAEALECATVASVSGLLRPERPLPLTRPFRAPHHTVSEQALVGGGPHCRPGEVTLAHHGVLFLDELPEFRRLPLEGLWRMLRAGEARITRGASEVRFPARPQVVASMNPCPCGYLGHPRQTCTCTASAVKAYVGRVDLRMFGDVIDLPAVSAADLRDAPRAETSATVRARVTAARAGK